MPGPRGRLIGQVRRIVAPSIRPSRLLLALKAAIAAGLAWPAAQLLPGAVDEYSYYAPLGALISMTPTLMGSLRSSLQTALGLALGIGLAWAVLESPLPGSMSVPIAVGIGVVLGGLRGLGSGRDYVPIAALFVLVIGGTRAGDYSLGYIVQMAVGMAIGIAVNLIIVPPLYLRESAAEITALREEIAHNLDGIAAALTEKWPPKHTDWFDGVALLDSSIRGAEPIIDDARESRRINPRVWWHRYDMQEDFDDLEALTRLSALTQDLGEAISSAIWAEPVPAGIPVELREPLSAALARTADLVRAWNARSEEGEAAVAANRALAILIQHFERRTPVHGHPDEAMGSVVFDLRRMLALVRSRLRSSRQD